MTTPLCDLPEDMSLLRETARRFMRHEVRPEEDKLPHDATELPADVLKRLQAKARALGIWQVESPVEWGRRRTQLARPGRRRRTGVPVQNGGLYSRVPRLRLGSANRDI